MINRELNHYDWLKSFAILLVVIGHVTILYRPDTHPEINTQPYVVITKLINIFHMPLFMALSGAIYSLGLSRGKYTEIIPFFSNKAKRLLIPYLAVGLLFMIPTLVLINPELQFNQPDLYKKILFATDNRHLWFLLSLFWIFIFQYISDRAGLNHWVELIIAIGLATGWSIMHPCDFMCISNAIHNFPFFIFGVIIQRVCLPISKGWLATLSMIGVIVCGGGVLRFGYRTA